MESTSIAAKLCGELHQDTGSSPLIPLFRMLSWRRFRMLPAAPQLSGRFPFSWLLSSVKFCKAGIAPDCTQLSGKDPVHVCGESHKVNVVNSFSTVIMARVAIIYIRFVPWQCILLGWRRPDGARTITKQSIFRDLELWRTLDSVWRQINCRESLHDSPRAPSSRQWTREQIVRRIYSGNSCCAIQCVWQLSRKSQASQISVVKKIKNNSKTNWIS